MFYIEDGFYADPMDVRKVALGLDFNITGNYPGARTEACGGEYFTNIKKSFEKILQKKIVYWPSGYNTAFQYTTENNSTWIHHDSTRWAAIVYLSPDAPVESGTSLYRHIPTGIFEHTAASDIDFNEEKTKEVDWEETAFCGNIFNRLVLYNGFYYHRSKLPGFGIDKFSGRLFQTFFFDTED